MNWYVIYTKSRFEKAISEKLASIGVEVYCPLLKTKKRWSDRWKWVEEPLFRSYCFVYLNNSDRDQVFSVSGVVKYLHHCGKPAIVRDKEIEILKDWLTEYEHVSIETVKYNSKDQVVLRSGVLMDQKAEVISGHGNFLSLRLESLGLKIRVDLRKNIVEKLTGC